VRLWGQLLANAHAAGLRAMGVPLDARAAAIGADAGRRQQGLITQAWELARFNAQAFAAFRRRRAR
jgi:hypothetical protein